MKRIHSLALVSILTLLLAACSSEKAIDNETPASELFARAQTKLQDGVIRSAITDLETLDNRYPFGTYSTQTQLDLIYAYYKTGQYELAQGMIDRFIRLNPTHPNIDYVLYMRGLTNMALNDNYLQDLVTSDRADRDTTNSDIAFKDFQHLISNFPNSPYSKDAQLRMMALKNGLAKHELEIIKYYTKRGAFVAVVNRTENMMKYFPDTLYTYQALSHMENAYKAMGLNQEAAKVNKLIQENKK